MKKENKMENCIKFKEDKKYLFILSVAIFAHTFLFSILSCFSSLFNIKMDEGFLTLSIALLSLLPYFLIYGTRSIGNEIKTDRIKFSIKEIVIIFAVIIVLNQLASILIYELEPLLNFIGLTGLDDPSMEMSNTAGDFIYSIIGAPVIEEIAYRGVIMRKLEKYGAYFAIAASSLLFGLMHMNLSQSFVTFFMGFVLGYSAYKYSLKFSIIIHMLNNLSVELTSYVSKSNEWLSNFLDYFIFISSFTIFLFILVKNRKEIFLKVKKLFVQLKESRVEIKSGKRVNHSLLFFTRIGVIIVLIFDIIAIVI